MAGNLDNRKVKRKVVSRLLIPPTAVCPDEMFFFCPLKIFSDLYC
jgi:hypothetical protein